MLDCTKDSTFTIRNLCINFEQCKSFNLIKLLYPGKRKYKSLTEMASHTDSDSEPIPLCYFQDKCNYLYFYRRRSKTIFNQMRFVHYHKIRRDNGCKFKI